MISEADIRIRRINVRRALEQLVEDMVELGRDELRLKDGGKRDLVSGLAWLERADVGASLWPKRNQRQSSLATSRSPSLSALLIG